MGRIEKDIEELKMQIAEVDQAIYDLASSVKIIGEIDQDRKLIISEQETLPEAVERQGKLNGLLARRRELKAQLN